MACKYPVGGCIAVQADCTEVRGGYTGVVVLDRIALVEKATAGTTAVGSCLLVAVEAAGRQRGRQAMWETCAGLDCRAGSPARKAPVKLRSSLAG